MNPAQVSVGEAVSFLDRFPDVEAVDLILYDGNGVGRGKIIRRSELVHVFEQGVSLPASILGQEVCGEDVDATGLVWDRGDGDMRAWPVSGTLKIVHGSTPLRGEMLISLYDLDGSPMPSDPRHVLERQIKRLADRGLRASAAFELEFFLLDNERDGNGAVRPAKDVLDGRSTTATDVYSMEKLQGMLPLFNEIYAAAEAAGIPIENMISEYAPGQYELTVHYRNDVMQAATDLMTLKRIVKQQARIQGITACFMAKPMSECAGSGMHCHLSLQNQEGQNAFAETGSALSPTLLHAIGGARRRIAESMLIFAPHANSWRRFVSESYAPVSPTWGINNRSVALRIPDSEAVARRIEHRVAGVDANPLLVASVFIAAIIEGLEQGLDPGPQIEGNGYEVAPDSGSMPGDWAEAIRVAKKSSFLKEALGEEMHHTYVAVKEAEYIRVMRSIPEIDYELYLYTV